MQFQAIELWNWMCVLHNVLVIKNFCATDDFSRSLPLSTVTYGGHSHTALVFKGSLQQLLLWRRLCFAEFCTHFCGEKPVPIIVANFFPNPVFCRKFKEAIWEIGLPDTE